MALFQPISARTSVQTSLQRKVLDALVARLKRDNGSYVTVGVHSDAGTYEDVDGRDTPVAAVALWMEYGTVRSPARPFLYSTMSAKEQVLKRLLAYAQAMVVAGKKTVEAALASVGFEAQTFVQNAIKSNVGPALSEGYLTRRRKQFPESGSRTLIRSGLLLRSIRFKVFVNGSEVAGGHEPQYTPAQEHGADARARGRHEMLHDKSARAKQRLAAKRDPDAAQHAFDAQRRVRPERHPKGKE